MVPTAEAVAVGALEGIAAEVSREVVVEVLEVAVAVAKGAVGRVQSVGDIPDARTRTRYGEVSRDNVDTTGPRAALEASMVQLI